MTDQGVGSPEHYRKGGVLEAISLFFGVLGGVLKALYGPERPEKAFGGLKEPLRALEGP